NYYCCSYTTSGTYVF
nr:immunoglobulin light chain junction region [Macaca mulatta]MOV70200.1 immunoglobulin light chain junction region [Macaca mulatta]